MPTTFVRKNTFVLELDQYGDEALELDFTTSFRHRIRHLVVVAAQGGPSYKTSIPNNRAWLELPEGLKTLDIILEQPTVSPRPESDMDLAQELSIWHSWLFPYLQAIANYVPLTTVIKLDCDGARETLELFKDHLHARFTE
ncbi:hypothetical protein N7478_005655 [Penicillium angulare]|uniref:uncharacterized protein n=1 Tax=Penicillium angulare TaxID=116970 RepID=UPI0025417C39|nr:uncharacterized protein N7478_005655 [Penicillium angulare]KAJ5280283.1 hypothetical protein N7478_005655 [Penicillium angulare]